MTRKIILDCDPGIDDAIALCMALFDPRFEVVAVTATAGTIDAAQATNNVSALIERLDPPRYPRVGKATSSESASVFDNSHLHGMDGLGGLNLHRTDRQNQIASDKLIADFLRRFPGEITIVCLGPLTNLSRLMKRDPGVIPLIDQIIISGGAITQPGNASVVAEFNMFFDPPAAQEVFASPTTKSLVPLDVTANLTFGVDLLEHLPGRSSRVGGLVHQLLPFAFRMARNRLGRELIPLYDPITLLAVMEPSLFQWEPMAGGVETRGELTRGMTVFDMRMRPEWTSNLEVATDVNASDAEMLLIRSLKFAGQHSG